MQWELFSHHGLFLENVILFIFYQALTAGVHLTFLLFKAVSLSGSLVRSGASESVSVLQG